MAAMATFLDAFATGSAVSCVESCALVAAWSAGNRT